ncbi:Golgi reassembly-stacking protein 2 [Lutzomyia longipalpis]|uniref:Golgi reassembly-stacking protein 2 n=1 Tax=Lutzomyia longipalpis TaxID=7200 RepID=UPI002483DF5B|nr:Golgi reassembly-stacking protein 2 [Lutzomyia longipalpis]
MGVSHSVNVPGGGSEGYHVLRVQDNSPGQRAGLEAFFDFIVAIGNIRLDQDNDSLKELLKLNVEKEIKMVVYSSKTQTVREVQITPSAKWGGTGLLGVSIRFCSFEGVNENVWHILEVHPSSPAEEAGLRSFSDYIIGADSVLHESEDLFTLIVSHEGRPLKMYVYNTDDDACREVTIRPNSKWGGEGSMGCGIGYGYLHRIPVRTLPEEKKPLFRMPINVENVTTTTPPLIAPTNTTAAAFVPTTPEPTIPFVPPLTNTFPNVSGAQNGEAAAHSALPAASAVSLATPQQVTTNTFAPTVATSAIPGVINTSQLFSGVPSTTPDPFAGVTAPPMAVPPVPMYSPHQIPAPAPIHHIPAFSSAATTSASPLFAPPPPAALSYPVMEPQPPPPLQTVSTYPQVAGTALTTPIALPGMPPITVSATIPAQALLNSFASTAPQN